MNAIRIYKVMVVAVLLGMASMSSALEETWTRKSDMLTARFGLSTSAVDGKIYAIGGGRALDGPYLSTVEEYEPATDTWTRKADMPTARIGRAAGVVNGKIYVIGGAQRRGVSIPTVEEYDPATDTWRQRADMPTRRTFHCACTLDGKIHVFAGRTDGVPGADWNLVAMEVYDPSTDTWTRKANIATPRAGAGAAVVDGKMYVIGGVTGGSLHNAPLSTVEEYDPAADTWTRKADMPTARMFLSTSVVDGKIYAIGGGIWNGPIFSTVEKYDPATDTWTTEPDMATRRYTLSTSAVNGKIYAIGGTQQWYPCPGISTVEEYDTGLRVQSPDFNGDGIVDIKDLLRLIQSWDRDDPFVDIAPIFGDGVIDVLDLELLMSFWGQPVDDPTLIAHWALDEIEGDTAYDSAGINDAYIIGEPVWQPEGGKIGGALTFDGVDDYALTQYGLNPAEGPFSVFAWIQGGMPGQVVISQIDGANWLGVDPVRGCLMTELCSSGRSGFPLHSEILVTDGNWHRIGLVWDGSNRILYVDDLLVAEDTQNGLESSNDGLYIGCGKNMQPGTYWSGLIDDVRIYNRAVIP